MGKLEIVTHVAFHATQRSKGELGEIRVCTYPNFNPYRPHPNFNILPEFGFSRVMVCLLGI